ncbi:MAG: 16S rRNA (guanine(527)-N(7))-methyltransferase RsmG [Synechococcus sp.]
MPTPPTDSVPSSDLWEALGWLPSTQQLDQFQALQQELLRWNSRVNLTRLLEGDDFWVAQIVDSLWPLRPELDSPEAPRRCIDVGTGGGFPGLAVAIALPGAQLTLVDSVGRKTTAVLAMADAIGLRDRVQVRTERVELTGRDRSCRGQFDLAMARAVAAAPVVAEYLVPLLQPRGEALLYRGRWDAANQRELEQALQPLNAKIRMQEGRELPAGKGMRHQFRLQPTAPCPKLYPRAVGLPAKLPLGSLGR